MADNDIANRPDQSFPAFRRGNQSLETNALTIMRLPRLISLAYSADIG